MIEYWTWGRPSLAFADSDVPSARPALDVWLEIDRLLDDATRGCVVPVTVVLVPADAHTTAGGVYTLDEDDEFPIDLVVAIGYADRSFSFTLHERLDFHQPALRTLFDEARSALQRDDLADALRAVARGVADMR